MYFTTYIIIGIGVACSIGLLVGVGALIRFYQGRRHRRSIKPEAEIPPLGSKEYCRDEYFASLHSSSFRLSPRVNLAGSQLGLPGAESQSMSPDLDPGCSTSPAPLIVCPAQALVYDGVDLAPSSSMRYLIEDDLRSPEDSSTMEKTVSTGTAEEVV
eukprot:GGOE01024569.1.p1 GENE.GGOE01024569.1~~GGOE01024569.1.p1  ORF type:complete len:157 (-),score=23.98 GGOE01024569.1:137-607(-)